MTDKAFRYLSDRGNDAIIQACQAAGNALVGTTLSTIPEVIMLAMYMAEQENGAAHAPQSAVLEAAIAYAATCELELAQAVHDAQLHERDRHRAKSEAIADLMQTIDPQTSKQYSATAAEKVVGLTDRYRNYSIEAVDCTIKLQHAQFKYDCAMALVTFQSRR